MRSCTLILVIELFVIVNGASFFNNPFKSIKCMFYECCRPPYIKQNFTNLENKLNKYLYGQPLVKNTLVAALKSHFVLENQRKALVLSFHGSTGVGKNYVTQFVAESLFERGVRSRYFKQFIATKDFPHNDKINEYKDKIRKSIEEITKECSSSLFVFDETDKIPIGLMDTIKAYIDYNQEIEGVDFRKTVFIFLSNSAGNVITEMTLQMSKDQQRESFELRKFQSAIQNNVYFNKDKENKGLHHASIIDSHLIDFYIPFLPLERPHVKQCIKDELEKYEFKNKNEYFKKTLEQDVESVADQLGYEPEGLRLFVSSGCKRIPNLVRMLIVENKYELQPVKLEL